MAYELCGYLRRLPPSAFAATLIELIAFQCRQTCCMAFRLLLPKSANVEQLELRRGKFGEAIKRKPIPSRIACFERVQKCQVVLVQC